MPVILLQWPTRSPGYKVPLLIGWTGMRGVVSLAAALSIPLKLDDGSPFPQRNLILFITFVVILLTLLVQGLTLPYLIRKINMPDPDQHLPEEEIEHQIKRQLAEHALLHLRTNYNEQLNTEPVLQQMALKWEHNSLIADNDQMSEKCKAVYMDIINRQREWLHDKNRAEATLNEEIIRKHLMYLDMEEMKLRYL